jgi:ribosomal protein L22
MTPPEDEETPETEAEEPKRPRRRRRKAASEDAPASEAPRSESGTESQGETTRGASAADASPETEVASELSAEEEPDAVDETPADVEAEEAAADVMLEADAEAEGDADDEEPEAEADLVDEVDGEHEAEAQAPAPARRRRRRGGAEPAEEPPPAPSPARRRDRRERPAGPPPVVRAQAKYVRSSARKARLVCDHIRGKSVEEARAILAHTPRAVARDWSKLLESAVANAENNHELVGEDLYVKAIHADEGPTIRRFQPRAMGRATRIRKRTSHLTILLTPKD